MTFFKTITAAAVLGLTAGAASAATLTFNGVDFEDGERAFVDSVVSFTEGSKVGIDVDGYSDTSQTLGTPDYVSGNGYLSLGVGGSVTLQFTDNALSGSGDDKDDLFVFEIGKLIEGTLVEISKNGTDFFSVGGIGIDPITGERNYGIDIDAFGFGVADVFSFVRLTDDGIGGVSNGWSGADIDAVAALSSVAAAEGLPAVPLPAAGWLMLAAFGGLATLKRRKV